MCVALTVSILVVRVAFNYMNNEARALPLVTSRGPLLRAMCAGNNNKNNNGNNNDRATLRVRMKKRKWSASRPRLLKVRDGSVAETLPSFAFNPDPHFVGGWSILHLPPILAAVVFRSYLLGLVNLENGRHIVSPSLRACLFSLSLFLSLSPPTRFLPLAPAAIATARFFAGSFSFFLYNDRSWNTMDTMRGEVSYAGYDQWSMRSSPPVAGLRQVNDVYIFARGGTVGCCTGSE